MKCQFLKIKLMIKICRQRKRAFLQNSKMTEEDGYLHNPLKNPVSRYEIKAGTTHSQSFNNRD